MGLIAKMIRGLSAVLRTLVAAAFIAIVVAACTNHNSPAALLASFLDIFSYVGPLSLVWLGIAAMGGGGSYDNGHSCNTDGTPMTFGGITDINGRAHGDPRTIDDM